MRGVGEETVEVGTEGERQAPEGQIEVRLSPTGERRRQNQSPR